MNYKAVSHIVIPLGYEKENNKVSLVQKKKEVFLESLIIGIITR